MKEDVLIPLVVDGKKVIVKKTDLRNGANAKNWLNKKGMMGECLGKETKENGTHTGNISLRLFPNARWADGRLIRDLEKTVNEEQVFGDFEIAIRSASKFDIISGVLPENCTRSTGHHKVSAASILLKKGNDLRRGRDGTGAAIHSAVNETLMFSFGDGTRQGALLLAQMIFFACMISWGHIDAVPKLPLSSRELAERFPQTWLRKRFRCFGSVQCHSVAQWIHSLGVQV